MHLVENSSAQKAKVTIHIAQVESKKDADNGVVEPSDEDAVQGIGPGYLEPVDHIVVLGGGFYQPRQFARVIESTRWSET